MKLFKKTFLIAALGLCMQADVFAQQAPLNLPQDYLTPAFHAGRRQALRNLMPTNSVAVIFAYPEQVFSNDVNYVYHANPDMYYFSGYKEPDAALLIFKDMQGSGANAYNEVLFVRERNAAREQWTGRRLGVEGAKAQLGFKQAYNSTGFEKFDIDFKKFSTVFYDGLPDDATGELSNMVKVFKAKAGIADIDKSLQGDLQMIDKYGTAEMLPRIMSYLKPKLENPAYKNSPLIQQLVAKPDEATLAAVKQEIQKTMGGMAGYTQFTTELRGVKTSEELVLLKKSVYLSSIAHKEVIKAVNPAMSERELEGIMLYVHKKYGAEDEGYPPIVGAGGNGCILHYEENSAMKLENQLVLMDVGAEYHGYSADVTRTMPANGKFTDEQKAIYQLVYDAQEAVFPLCKAGVKYADLEAKTEEVLTAGLIKLGIIKNASELRTYYPHGVSHHLGLDVHDRGDYTGDLKENMVITVEPGIYIPGGSSCDKKWWNIGVRIEDDVQIGATAPVILSSAAPRTWQDVEKVAAMKSMFDQASFPQLK